DSPDSGDALTSRLKDEVLSIGSPISAAFLRVRTAPNGKQPMKVSSCTGDLPERKRTKVVVRNGEAQSGAVRGPSNEGGGTIGQGRQFLGRTAIDVGSTQLVILGEDDCAPVRGPGRVVTDQTTQTPRSSTGQQNYPQGLIPLEQRARSQQLRAVRRDSAQKRPSERSPNRARRTIACT